MEKIGRWGAVVVGVAAAMALAGPAHASTHDAAAVPVTTLAQDNGIECVDINTAGVAELQQLLHIGPERAQAIPFLRPFSSEEDITRIPGIGEGLLQGLIHGGGDALPLCPITAAADRTDHGELKALPLTGMAAPALVTGGLVLGGIGAGAVLLSRRRRRVFVAS